MSLFRCVIFTNTALGQHFFNHDDVFGHVHEGYGIYKDEVTTFINASLLSHKYDYTNNPVIINT